jgi:hypothetical protein
MTKPMTSAIQEIAEASQIGAKYPDWSFEVASDSMQTRTEMAGLALKTDLHGCPGCALTVQRKKVRDHLSKKCQGKCYGDNDILSGLTAQTLNVGITKANIRVAPRTSDAASPAVPDLLTRVEAFDWKSRRPTGIPNARMISPWLMRTHWM